MTIREEAQYLKLTTKDMKARRSFLTAILVTAALGLFLMLAACSPGGSPKSGPSTAQERGTVSTPEMSKSTPTPTAAPVAEPASSPSSAAAREIEVTLKNNTFPKEIRVKAGEKVVFVVTNEGTVMHTFEFPDFDEMRYNEIKRGQTVRIEWVVPNKKGKWDMGCFLTEEGFHERMEGNLIIE